MYIIDRRGICDPRFARVGVQICVLLPTAGGESINFHPDSHKPRATNPKSVENDEISPNYVFPLSHNLSLCLSVCLSVSLSLSLSLSSFKSAVGFPNWMNGADPIVSVTISAALGIIVVGMAIAYLINKWRRKDDARNEALNGK